MQKSTGQKILFAGMSLVILAAVVLAIKNNLPQKEGETPALEPVAEAPHKETLPRIAKVGVTQDPRMYLYSIKTMDSLKQLGFRYFFLTLNWTSDNKLVCMQQWDTVAPHILKDYTYKKPPTLKEFSTYESMVAGTKPCTLATLDGWLKANPDAVVVVDFIERGEEAMKAIATQSTVFGKQIIPIVHQASEASAARSLGYQKLMLATYQLAQWPDDNIYQLARQSTAYAVLFRNDVLAPHKALIQHLQKDGMGIYTYTTNDCASLSASVASGADGVMTDSEAPGTCQ